MNCQEIKEHISGIFHNEPLPAVNSGLSHKSGTSSFERSSSRSKLRGILAQNEQIPPKPAGKLTRAQTKEHQESVQKIHEINQKRGRERFKVAVSGLILGVAGLGLILVFNTPDQAKQVFITPVIDKTPVSSMINQDDFHLETNEVGIPLSYAEAVTIGDKIEFRNESRRVNFTVAMSRISQEIGTEAGLMQLRKPLIIRFVDTASEINTIGGMTGFDSDSGRSISEIVVPVFIDQMEQQAKLPNTPLLTPERKTGYLSVLLSTVTLVEIANQANVQKYTGLKPDQSIIDKIDIDSNLLGAKYSRLIISRQAKPFIIVK